MDAGHAETAAGLSNGRKEMTARGKIAPVMSVCRRVQNNGKSWRV